MHEIERANQETLYGIFGDAPWTNKDRLPDSLLRDLLEHFSRISLGNQAAQADVLGQAYEGASETTNGNNVTADNGSMAESLSAWLGSAVDLRAARIPLPPLTEQVKLVESVREVEAACDRARQAYIATRRVMASLLEGLLNN